MKTFVCERCGKSYSTFNDCEKIHFCDKCTKDIIRWINDNLDIVFNGIRFVKGDAYQ